MPNEFDVTRQRRGVLELRAADMDVDTRSMEIEGKAISYDSPTLIFSSGGIDYFEQIARSALDTADTSQTCLRYNHKDAVPMLARTAGGSLQLRNESDGLYFRAKLFDTTASRDCFELVRQGVLQCSFGFVLPDRSGYIYDAEKHLRTIVRIDKLIDLSIVDIPAYKDTFVSARDLFSMEQEYRDALKNADRRRRELIALTI